MPKKTSTRLEITRDEVKRKNKLNSIQRRAHQTESSWPFLARLGLSETEKIWGINESFQHTN
jgi:hypothetical protein